MANTTTFRADYVPHKVTMRPAKATVVYLEPTEAMELKSTYMQDFVSHPVHKNIVSKTVTYNAPTAKMDTQSVYQEVYRCWGVVRPDPFRASDNLTLSQDKFDATTTCQDDFCPKSGGPVRESFKPTQQVQESQPFDGTTSYRLAFVSHPLQQRPPRKKVPYEPNAAPFNGVSIHRQDFRGLRGEVAKSTKIKSTWEASATPFEGVSEYQERYQAWPVQPPFQRKSDGHCLPGGAMELISTAHGDFAGQQGPPAVSARPPIQAWCKGKPFDACSTMKTDYRAWEAERRGRTVRAEQTSPPSGPFESSTTSRREYTRKSVPRAPSYKPAQRPMSPRTMADDTVYRASYVNREHRRCPASFADPPGFEYKALGSGGHVLFRTASAAGEQGAVRPSTATAARAMPSHAAKTRAVRSATLRRGKRIH